MAAPDPSQVPDEGQMTPSGRIIYGRRPMALRFGLTLFALALGAIYLAFVGQWFLSLFLVFMFALMAIGLAFWSNDKGQDQR